MKSCFTIGVVLATSFSAVSQPRQDVSPGHIGSHQYFLEQLGKSKRLILQGSLAKYDAYLKEHPRDVTAWIEKGKFLRELGYDEDLWDAGITEMLEEVDSELESFPYHGGATAFRAGDLDAQEAISLLEDYLRTVGDLGMRVNEWEVYDELARRFDELEQPYKALHHATEAVKLNDTLDLSLLMAVQCERVGDKATALSYLKKHFRHSNPWWVQNQKAEMLQRLGDLDLAALVYASMEETDTTNIDRLGYARVLHQLGRPEEASKQLALAAHSGWNQEASLRAIFRLQLDFGASDSALFTYQKLRNLGFAADPLAGERLALFIHQPLASWELRDLLGILALITAIAVLCFLPALWMIPIHYIGLLRGHNEATARWHLGHLWVLSGMILLAGFVSELIYNYDGILDLFRGYVESLQNRQSQAQTALLFFFFMAVVCAGFMKKSDFTALWLGNWSKGKSVWTGIGWAFLLRIFLSTVLLILFYGFGVTLGDGHQYEFFQPSAGGTSDYLVALKETYGSFVLLVFGVMIVPFYEEFFFRTIFLQGFQSYLSPFWANVAQALLFALFHEELILLPFYFTLGMIAGWLRMKSGSLVAPLSLHMSNNFMALVRML